MRLNLLALLIVLVFAEFQAPAQSESEERILLDPPMRTTLVIEGKRTPFSGEITSWSFGSFWTLRRGGEVSIRVDWDQLEPNKVFQIMRRTLERDDAQGFLRLGIEMLILDEPAIAQRAFRVVERVDPSLSPIVEKAIELFEQGDDPSQVTVIEPPEEAPVESPVVVPEQTGAFSGLDLRSRASARTEKMSGPIEQIETEHFIVIVQGADVDSEQFAATLERILAEFAQALGVGDDEAIFDDKCVCYLLTNASDFRALAKQIGKNTAANERSFFLRNDDAIGVELAFIISEQNARTWEYLMYRDCARAIIDHFRSDRPLPHWVEIGLIRHVRLLIKSDGADVNKQIKQVREYCQYNSVAVFIRRSHKKFDLMGGDSTILSHLLVRSLILNKPAEFADWLSRIKGGDDWEFAMEESLGVDVNALGRWFESELGVDN